MSYNIKIDAMKLAIPPYINHNKLPYNGNQIEFLSKNLRITTKGVFDILSLISLTSEELVLFIVNERLKNRKRHTAEYTTKLFR